MILGIGIDIIEIERIRQAVERTEGFLERVFTKDEISMFEKRKMRTEVIAGNFAAKEAVVKALSTGFNGFAWNDVEILRDALGKPYVILYDNAKKFIGENSIIHVSISHCKEYAVANAILESWDEVSQYGNIESNWAKQD